LRLKIIVAVAGLAAFALSSTPASAGNGDKVTGGGQILVGSNAGSTIAFTAQGTTTSAKGQVQFIDRSAGKGQNQVKFHGVVDCVEVTGNFAVVGGLTRSGDDFTLRVVDGGEPNRGADSIQFDRNGDFQCGDGEEDDPPEFALGRGNAQVRDGNESNPPTSSSSTTTSTSLLSVF
jgi:hypothetical protein